MYNTFPFLSRGDLMKRVIENLENKNEHYLYPFFWQKGQSNEKLKEYIDQMREQGIYNIFF